MRTWIMKQLFQVFSSLCQRRREIETKTLCKHLKTGTVSTKSFNGKLTWPCEEKNWLSKDCTKLRQTWRSNIGKREIRILLFMRPIRSLNPNVYSYTRRINGLIRLKEDKTSMYEEVEMKNRLFRENKAKDCHEIADLRRICCEEADRARQAIIDELSMHQERNPTTVSQLLTQSQDLQNKVNCQMREIFLRS